MNKRFGRTIFFYIYIEEVVLIEISKSAIISAESAIKYAEIATESLLPIVVFGDNADEVAKEYFKLTQNSKNPDWVIELLKKL
jgi:hypothetical protein